jgi:hypothetical protein
MKSRVEVYSSNIFGLGTRRRRVVSFTHRPLYLREKSSRYRLDRRLDVPQSRFGGCREEKDLLPMP